MKLKTCKQIYDELYTRIDERFTMVVSYDKNEICILTFGRLIGWKLKKMLSDDVILKYNFYYKYQPKLLKIEGVDNHIHRFLTLKILTIEDQKKKLRKEKLKSIL